MDILTAILGAGVRRETSGGKSYLVAPVTLIVPGVLPGSDGPLYYPPDEVSGSAASWDRIPLVVNHPVGADGKPVSARTDAAAKSTIGEVRAPRYTDKLVGEAWIEEARAKASDPRILAALESGTKLEVSTGLFLDQTPVENGIAPDGRGYKSRASNFRPDHLAILPDAKGACSLNDGCGLNVNQLGQAASLGEVTRAEFFMTLLHAATSAHVLHLQTRSFAAHMALDELYKELPGLVDDLIEACQGVYGVVESYPGGYMPPSLAPAEFVKAVSDYVKANRGVIGPETELQNITDEIAGLIDGVLYKLRFLS